MTERAKYPPTEVVLAFGDGEYCFRLPSKLIAELQEKCGAGIGAIYGRVMLSQYKIEDVDETIRLGLIGGGLSPVDAKRLTDTYLDFTPFHERWNLARSILFACAQGYEAPGKPAARSETAGSTSPEPMFQPQRSEDIASMMSTA